MSWELLPWQSRYDEHSGALSVADESRRSRGSVTLLLPQEYQKIAVGRWRHTRGRLIDGGTAVLALPDGTTGRIGNGRANCWRRRHHDGAVEIAGLRYDVRHRSRRRTEVLRGGRLVATLRRMGWRTPPADDTSRVRLRRHSTVDGLDTVVVMVVATTLGTPGRTGFLGYLTVGILHNV